MHTKCFPTVKNRYYCAAARGPHKGDPEFDILQG